MKFLKYLLPIAMVTAGAVRLHASAGDANTDNPGSFSTVKEARQSDEEFVSNYINTKRAIPAAEKSGNLSVSGDVRTEWDYMKCKTDGVRQRGLKTRNMFPSKLLPKVNHKEYSKKTWQEKFNYRAARANAKAPYPHNEFSVEANIMLDYVAERGWAAIRLQLSNPMGIAEVDRKPLTNDGKNILYGSGKMSNLALRKAYMGYNIWEEGTSRFDIEIGRRRLYDVFDSRVQFYSLFDGVLLRYATSFDGKLDFAAKAAAFVVDYTVNHWGFVGELDFLNIADTGVDFKYSLITWDKDGINRFGKRHPLGNRFTDSQFTLAYNFTPESFNHKMKFYGAYIINHSADKTSWTHHKKENEAFYVGYTIGEVVKQGDWALDIDYEWVQAQAVNERDLRGIARDNPRNISFYNRRSQGFSNYKGYKIDGFYAITDDWTGNLSFERVHQQSRSIGGKHRSYQVAVTSIFAF